MQSFCVLFKFCLITTQLTTKLTLLIRFRFKGIPCSASWHVSSGLASLWRFYHIDSTHLPIIFCICDLGDKNLAQQSILPWSSRDMFVLHIHIFCFESLKAHIGNIHPDSSTMCQVRLSSKWLMFTWLGLLTCLIVWKSTKTIFMAMQLGMHLHLP